MPEGHLLAAFSLAQKRPFCALWASVWKRFATSLRAICSPLPVQVFVSPNTLTGTPGINTDQIWGQHGSTKQTHRMTVMHVTYALTNSGNSEMGVLSGGTSSAFVGVLQGNKRINVYVNMERFLLKKKVPHLQSAGQSPEKPMM